MIKFWKKKLAKLLKFKIFLKSSFVALNIKLALI